MTNPDPSDITAIGGAHPGTQSRQEMSSSASIEIDTSRSLSDVANQVISSAEFHFNSFADTNRSPKYAVDPNV